MVTQKETLEKTKQNGRLNQALGKCLRIEDAIAGGYKSVSRTIVAQIQLKIRPECMQLI